MIERLAASPVIEQREGADIAEPLSNVRLSFDSQSKASI
jgi:hypothetical protein